MSDIFFKGDLIGDANFGGKKQPSAIGWKIATVILSVVVIGLSFLLLSKPKVFKPDVSTEIPRLGRDVQESDITNKVYQAFESYICYVSTGDTQYIDDMMGVFTVDFANSFRIVANDPELRDLVRAKKVEVSTEIDKPKILEVDKKGVITVFISGKVIVGSKSTRYRSHSRYFTATAKVVMQDGRFKIANFIPKFSE